MCLLGEVTAVTEELHTSITCDAWMCGRDPFFIVPGGKEPSMNRRNYVSCEKSQRERWMTWLKMAKQARIELLKLKQSRALARIQNNRTLAKI